MFSGSVCYREEPFSRHGCSCGVADKKMSDSDRKVNQIAMASVAAAMVRKDSDDNSVGER
jgi:hypothetical protein